MAKHIESFEFKQSVSIIKSTGKKARNLSELRKQISQVGDECIFHHVYQYFLKGHVLEYTNDFAQWAGESLEERALAERLASIDPYTLKSVSEVRKELLSEIDIFLADFPEPRDVVGGNEFYFNETVSLVFPVGVRTRNLAEFLVAIEHIDAGSIYYHFYDSRVRLGEGVIDDFSRWIEHTLGRKNLAVKIRAIDPFMHSIESIREHIREILEEYVRADMEGVAD
ncbi:MAG TPA: hypothetical protein ENG83_13205 [Nitrospirae bacterium]|nr:hypothetical protein BMS3Abin06_01821 [bacterium BMS3Abin06]HDH13133.1 hypothetical protein [Nitrospirota bacterium]HDZ03311.1 hypothetical protein [Nitrospirota bacterium]